MITPRIVFNHFCSKMNNFVREWLSAAYTLGKAKNLQHIFSMPNMKNWVISLFNWIQFSVFGANFEFFLINEFCTKNFVLWEDHHEFCLFIKRFCMEMWSKVQQKTWKNNEFFSLKKVKKISIFATNSVKYSINSISTFFARRKTYDSHK